MGVTLRIRCEECGYEAELDLGVGMAGIEVDGFICHDCHELYALVVGDYAKPGPMVPRCPKSSKHRVERWTEPGPCPKCGGVMKSTGPGDLWD